MNTTKQKLKAQRKRRLKKQANNQVPTELRDLYVSILKYGYSAKCRESILSPGSYLIDLKQYFNDQWYLQQQITLKPVKERDVRF